MQVGKKEIRILVYLGVAVFLGAWWVDTVYGSPFVFQFHSPSFSGNGWSTHMLSIEQLQHNREEDLIAKAEAEERKEERDEKNTTINKFIKNVESRIYANLSKQLVDNMFATPDPNCVEDCPEVSLTGEAKIEGSILTWVKDPDLGTITLTIVSEDGSTTEMIVPVGDFGF